MFSVCVCVAVYFLCVNHSFTSPSVSGDGQIRLNHDLKDFNFIVIYF